LAAPFVIIAGLWATPGLMVYDAIKVAPPAPAVAAAPDGRRLFLKHCASCHGENGDGKGSADLNPSARAFGYEPFKFATTRKRQELGYAFACPTDDDLLSILKRGIPGSAMPAFQKPPKDVPPATQVTAELSDEELTAIIGHVRWLTWKGVYEKLLTVAMIRELKDVTAESDAARAVAVATLADWKEARKYANKPAELVAATDVLAVAGESLPRPSALPAVTPAAIAHGKELFVKATCASCHGPGGKGDGDQFREPLPGQPDKRPKNADGTPAYPRDLTAGIYKGGGDVESLYARIRLGIPGTPMPASEASSVSEADMADLIHFVQSLQGR
jgi:mono/diheme cytochrome c family protein